MSLFLQKVLFYRSLFAKETYHFKEPTNRRHPIISKHDILRIVTGWIRLDSLKLHISFGKYRLLYTALFHKRPIISRSPLTEATS